MKKFLFFITFLLMILTLNAQTTVKYTVSCNPAGFSVIYVNDIGIMEKKMISDSVWTTSFIGFDGDNIFVVAQSNNKNAIVKVKIEYKNNFKESIVTGNYPTATTSGFLKY